MSACRHFDSGDDELVEAAAEGVEIGGTVAGVDAIGQEGHGEPPGRIDPQRGSGEAGVAEGRRIEGGPGGAPG